MTSVFVALCLLTLSICGSLIVAGLLRLIAIRQELRDSRADSDYRAARLVSISAAEVGRG